MEEYFDEYEDVTNQDTSDNKVVKYAQENPDFARNYMKIHTPLNVNKLPGRNEICPYCKSGKKFKNCECYKTHTTEYRNKYFL